MLLVIANANVSFSYSVCSSIRRGDLSKKIEFSNILDFNSVGEDCPGP